MFPAPAPIPRKKVNKPLKSVYRWNFDPRLPEHWNMNPSFERRPDRLPQARDIRTRTIRGYSECPLCGRKYMFDTGFRRIDCECGCTFLGQTISEPDTRLRESITREMLARKEMNMKR